MELTINGIQYQTARLDDFKALHIARRLTPLVIGLQESLNSINDGAVKKAAKSDEKTAELFFSAVGPMAKAFAELSDADTEFIINTCLDVCQRQDSGVWARVRVNGRYMYEDIGLAGKMKLAMAVIKENLGDFFLNPLAMISA